MSASHMLRNSPACLHKLTSSLRSKGQTVNTCLLSSNQPLPLSIPSSSLAKFPKFTKKDLSSVSLEESHGPLLWQLHQPLAPLPPDAIKNLKSSAVGMCSRYIRHFLAKIKAAKGRTPSDECHYISIQEAWTATTPDWSYNDMLFVQHMYNFNAPHLPYVLIGQFPLTSPIARGSYPLDWCYQEWLSAARYLHLDCHKIEKFQPIPESNDLIQVGLEGEVPQHLEQSGTRVSIMQLAVALENNEAQLHGIAHYLMHQIVDHVAIINGLELPQFEVDHALVGAFFSVAEDDFPLAKLEQPWHSSPWCPYLGSKGNFPLDPLAMVMEPQCRIVADAVAHRPHDQSHGEFMEIWKMRQAEEVKHPSRCAMAGALADVLGPVTITLCDAVPLPPISSTSVASTPASPTEANVATPSRSLDDFNRAMLGVESEEEQEDKFLDFGLGFIAGNMDVHRIDKKCDLIQKAKMDPRWNAVIKDFQAIAEDPKAPSAKQRILDIVKAAQAKQKLDRSAFEGYVMHRWSNQPRRGAAKPYNLEGHGFTKSARAESSSMALQSHGWPPIEVILNLLTMFHLIISPLVVVLNLLDITLSLFVALDLLYITLDLLNDALDLLIASNSNPRHPDGRTWDYRQHNQEPSKLPKAPSSPVQSASLKEQLAPSTPSGHMGVDQAPSKLPTANCPPPTRMSLDESIPQATVPDPPGQHPRSMPDSFSVPLEVVNNVQSSQGTMEMDSAPPEVPPGSLDPVVPVGQWFCIEFTGVTAEVNMKEVFQSLVEDRLIGIRVRKDKFLPNPMKSASLSVKTKMKMGSLSVKMKMADPPVKVKRVLLAFKSQQRHDIVLAHFCDVPGFSPWQSTSMTALSPDHHEMIGSYRYLWDAEYVEMSYAHQQSPDDLTLLLQNAPACRNIGDLRDLHPFPPCIGDPVDLKFYIRYCFLDFNWYPPLVNPEKISPSRPCGPYDMLIREIAILAKLGAVAGDVGLKVFPTPRPRFLESCGFGDNQKWYIEWEPMELDP
ncbi:hypothetical protein BS47DRAFT_1367306 [Hydnum rufescens UP504]|uniref:Uncharacterized protein n=1 Tax=Hydnum rufescens UP504 TaxID=1448309 RepID=A0A9P6AJL9_9AGAM|nr:hypothetical protein BS47DRAFT_1367306 [Hydnum rufescens UP504]